MIPQESITLSAKFLGATLLAGFLYVVDLCAQAFPLIPDWATSYGLPGAISILLFYAIRAQFLINQKLQEDWRADRKESEAARLADRNEFFSKLEAHFVDAMQARSELIEAQKDLAATIKEKMK